LSKGDPVCLKSFFFVASIDSGAAFVAPALGLEKVELCGEDAARSFERTEAGRVGLSFGGGGRVDAERDWEVLGSDIEATSEGEAAS
jgi:hypothetical protein